MTEKEFNLLQEPWIRVMKENCQVVEVSLSDALIHAHEYRKLAGELPTQNAAVLRLLLAVLHAVFERVNIEGEKAEIEDSDDAIDRWAELWNNGCFPEEPLKTYFEKQIENFWLFHPARPFWQIPEIPDKASHPQSEPVQKLNGAISESGNKIRLFSERDHAEKTELSNSETARWLVCMNQYDDNTLKTGLGVALLGQFVSILAVGNTLFETLMLNFILLDREGEPWGEIGAASWENGIQFDESVRQIAYPHDPVAMLSYHSRYGKLIKENGKLTCYKSPKGGVCYEQISSNEPMSVWRKDTKSENLYIVRSLNGRQVWREFSAFFADKRTQSALVKWHEILIRNRIFSGSSSLKYEFVNIAYDKSQHSSVDNIFTDSLSLHSSLLSDLGKDYRMRIVDIITLCDNIAYYMGQLASDLFLASGGDVEKLGVQATKAKEEFYFSIDVPFRMWLFGLNADDAAAVREQKTQRWYMTVTNIAQKTANKMVQDAGRNAYIGKMISISKDNKKYYSSSIAMQQFKSKMKNIKL